MPVISKAFSASKYGFTINKVSGWGVCLFVFPLENFTLKIQWNSLYLCFMAAGCFHTVLGCSRG